MVDITAEELESKIREILDHGLLIYSGHVKARMVERNYTMGDVRHILKNGKIIKFNQEGTEKYHCEIHGEDLEGYMGGVITIVIKNTKLIIVTVLGGI
ncbi:MAG: DUF4258 domain-containing protein [Deltaproteobacteria bacterium]|nr:DUF4258 domain-containing protein [Deltaproteobacteria bacterium]